MKRKQLGRGTVEFELNQDWASHQLYPATGDSKRKKNIASAVRIKNGEVEKKPHQHT